MSDSLTSTRNSALVGLDGGHPVLAAVPPQAQARFWDFFGATIRNPNTRAAYLHAVGVFFDWCAKRELGLLDVRPLHVAGYIEPHRVPAHHKAVAYVEAYMAAAGIADQAGGPLFRSSRGQSRTLTDKPLHLGSALDQGARSSLSCGASAVSKPYIAYGANVINTCRSLSSYNVVST